MSIQSTEILNIRIGLSQQKNLFFPFRFFKTSGYETEFFQRKEKVGLQQPIMFFVNVDSFNNALINEGKIIFDSSKEEFGQPLLSSSFDKLGTIIEKLSLDMEEDDLHTTLILEYSQKGKEDSLFLIMQRNNGWALFNDSKNKIDEGEGKFIITNLIKKELMKTADTDEKGQIINFAKSIGEKFGLDDQTIDKIYTWVSDNPKLSAAIVAGGASAAYNIFQNLLGNKKFSLGDTLKDSAMWAAGGAVAAGLIDKLSSHSGLDMGGTGKGILDKLSGFVSGENYLVYDGGAKSDEFTSQLQRCLIRLGKGNLESERRNYQSPFYNPIIGIKVSGRKNYADDGRFGKWTLDASKKLFQQINNLNAADIQKDSAVEIKTPDRIPEKVLYSTACKDKTELTATSDEVKAADDVKSKMTTPIKESKIYSEFSFLSSKNQKLHSTLMEQLKKDLKRG